MRVTLAFLNALRREVRKTVVTLQDEGHADEELANALWHLDAAANAFRKIQQREESPCTGKTSTLRR